MSHVCGSEIAWAGAQVGFNRRAELAMAAWLYVPPFEFNEVGVLPEE